MNNTHPYLTERQENLVLNYIGLGENLYQSAIKAKFSETYSKVQSYQVVQQDKIQKKIKDARQQRDEDFVHKLGVTMSWRMNKLKRLVEDIIPDKGKGEIKHKYAHNAVKAMSEMTRLIGDYAPDRRVSLTVNTSLNTLDTIQRQYKEY